MALLNIHIDVQNLVTKNVIFHHFRIKYSWFKVFNFQVTFLELLI